MIKAKGITKTIVGHWNTKGKPFAKAKPNSKRTKEAIRILEKLQRRYRGKIYDVIDIGHKHMSNKLFIYQPPQNICLREFLRTTSEDRKHNKMLDILGITSWFRIFARESENEIYAKYYKVPKDKFPDITEGITKVVTDAQDHSRFTPYDQKNLINSSKLIVRFCKENEIMPKVIVDSIDRMFKNGLDMRSTRLLISEKFWNAMIPKELVRYGVFKSMKEIGEIDV